MSKFFFIFFLINWSCFNEEQNKNKEKIIQNSISYIESDNCFDFNKLNTKIRDGLISKQDALKQIQTLLGKLKKFYFKNRGSLQEKTHYTFPVQGYSTKSIGGNKGSGYIAMGYDYFAGNNHKGHPAHDIFIIDRNQDCIDDNTNNAVNVISMTGGIVIATENEWDTTSNLRGGKYIWIYEPASNSLFYYAHNNKIFVNPCEFVNPGDTIAQVGRTGFNAFKKRSPTHLHIMQLKLDSTYYPRPFDCYKNLINAKH
jgi:murein DD-endopeptidase MepM/ murein hydrolase activator NlpD